MLAGLVWCSIAWPQERERVLAALTLSYRQAAEKGKLVFELKADYFLSPVFSADGLLIEISIEPKSKNHERDPHRPVQLSKSEFESILTNINSIKPIGKMEEDLGGQFIHGGRAWGSQRYRNAYMRTAELISYASPRPIAFVYIYYLHPVTGVAKIPRDSKPEDAGSFGLVCVGGEAYIAPKAEFLMLWSKPNERQTVELAGPTGDDCG